MIHLLNTFSYWACVYMFKTLYLEFELLAVTVGSICHNSVIHYQIIQICLIIIKIGLW